MQFLPTLILYIFPRVDPGVKDGNDRSLTEIAIEKDSMDVVDLLWEAVQKEVPEKVRLQQLASVIYKEDGEEANKKFHALLKSLSPELVSLRNLFLLQIYIYIYLLSR